MKEKIDIEVRLFAYLRELLPPEKRGVVTLTIPSDYTINKLMDKIGIKDKEIMIVMVDGRKVLEHNNKLNPNSRVSIFPPVGGG
jgi:molybdopterin converting factor small subunit